MLQHHHWRKELIFRTLQRCSVRCRSRGCSVVVFPWTTKTEEGRGPKAVLSHVASLPSLARSPLPLYTTLWPIWRFSTNLCLLCGSSHDKHNVQSQPVHLIRVFCLLRKGNRKRLESMINETWFQLLFTRWHAKRCKNNSLSKTQISQDSVHYDVL